MRKIIQVAVDHSDSLWSLCNDGTLWTMCDGGTRWQECPPIPQDHEEIEPAPEPEGWRPWEHSPDRMWCVDEIAEQAFEVTGEHAFKAYCASIQQGDPKWTMVRESDAKYALAVWRAAKTSALGKDTITIDGVEYTFLHDNIPF